MLHPVISIRGDLVLASFKLVYNFLIKVDGVTVQNLTELPKRVVNLNYSQSNSCNGADLILLYKEGLSPIIGRLYSPLNKTTRSAPLYLIDRVG